MELVSTSEPVQELAMKPRLSALEQCADAVAWLRIEEDRGLAPRTIDAYRRALIDYLGLCAVEGIDPLTANRAGIARFVRDLGGRSRQWRSRTAGIESGIGLANATIQQRLTAVRLFYDYLVEEGRREDNPVGRGRYSPGRAREGQHERGLVPRYSKLPWIPTDAQWQAIVAAARHEGIRNRLMLALAYDAGLRREELCTLRADHIDPAHRTLRIRAEATKSRRERVIQEMPTSAFLG